MHGTQWGMFQAPENPGEISEHPALARRNDAFNMNLLVYQVTFFGSVWFFGISGWILSNHIPDFDAIYFEQPMAFGGFSFLAASAAENTRSCFLSNN